MTAVRMTLPGRRRVPVDAGARQAPAQRAARRAPLPTLPAEVPYGQAAPVAADPALDRMQRQQDAAGAVEDKNILRQIAAALPTILGAIDRMGWDRELVTDDQGRPVRSRLVRPKSAKDTQ